MSQVQMHSRATAAYRDAKAHPPARQIVLLHESAIRNLLDAKLAIAERRIEDRFHRVTRAHAIVGALQSSLDFEHGGEIAPLLDRLYDHILGRLMLINLQDDPSICDEIVHLLTRMREGWAEIASGAVPPGSVPPEASGAFAAPAALSA
ncbi:MAG: flagellar export chaperone FliS [Geminicoccaceae bacterium]